MDDMKVRIRPSVSRSFLDGVEEEEDKISVRSSGDEETLSIFTKSQGLVIHLCPFSTESVYDDSV
jgi:hypothetical protein